MSGSCQEALSNVREALPIVREWSGDTPGCPGMVEGPPRCSRVVGRPSRMSRSCQEALPVVWEWSGDPSECLECPPGYSEVVGGPL